MPTIKTHPVIFGDAMVKAILAGRKSQSRRVIRPPSGWDKQFYNKLVTEWVFMGGRVWKPFEESGQVAAGDIFCPYGIPGDMLWVCETFAVETNFNLESNDTYPPPFDDGRPIKWTNDEYFGDHWEQCHYRATDPTPELAYDDTDEPTVRWKPSIHMPRWASRITLAITDVRVERLQEISEEDAIAEGARGDSGMVLEQTALLVSGAKDLDEYQSMTLAANFVEIWDSFNAKRGHSWESNPWVWVVEFEVAND